MAVIVTDVRTLLNDADSITNWTGTVAALLFTADPDPVEATGHVGFPVSNQTAVQFVTIPSTDFTGKIIYAWALGLGAMDTLVNGGIGITVGDGTNRVSYHLSGSDTAVFRHNSGNPTYQCLILDQSSLPANSTVNAGSAAALNWAAITQVGIQFKTLAKAKGGSQNCWIDAIKLLDTSLNNGAALSITGGTSGTPGKFSEIAADDALTTSGKAYGVIRQLGAGVFGVQGPLRFGESTGTSSSWFQDSDVSVVFEQRGLTTSRYKIFITDNGTGTTTFRLGVKVGTGSTAVGSNGVSIQAATGVGWDFDAATDTDATDVFIYGSTFSGAIGGVKLRTGHEFIGGVISGSGTVEPNGATLVNTNIVGSTSTRALLWDINLETNGRLDGTSYSMGASGHAIELGPNTPASITFSGISFTGYGAAGTTNAAVYNNSGKSITINIVGGGSTPTVRNGTGASTTVNASVNVTLTGLKNPSEVRVFEAGTTTEVSGTGSETITSGTHAFSVASGQLVDIAILALGFQNMRILNFSTTSDASIPISQVLDRQYLNP